MESEEKNNYLILFQNEGNYIATENKSFSYNFEENKDDNIHKNEVQDIR